jgi:hypothetical protein
MRPLIGLLLGVNLTMAVTLVLGHEHFRLSLDETIVFVFCFGGGAAVLLADFFLLPWPAMAAALRGKKPYRALLGALVHGLAPSCLALFGFLVAVLGDIQTVAVVPLFFWLWAIASTVVLLIVALNRELELRGHFRTLAAGDDPCSAPRLPARRPILPKVTQPLADAAKA